MDSPDIGRITSLLYIGGARLAYECDWLRREGIRHVLKLYPNDPDWPEDFVVLELPIDDGIHIRQPILHEGVSYIDKAISVGEKVVVVCGLGISRSATFVLAYLLDQGYDLKEGFTMLRAGRPEAWPARELWESLITHYDLPYSVQEIYRWVRK